MFGSKKSSKKTDVTPEAVTAARWWGDQLRGGARLDNGDLSERGGMTMMLGILAQEAARNSNDLSDERITTFESELARLISSGLEHASSWGVTVSVDYNPDYILVEAATKAGISVGMTMFPWKTTMWVKQGSVSVSSGYRAPTEELEIT